MLSIIYKATNICNNKVYIGQTSGSLRERKNDHFLNAFKKNRKYKFYNAIRKYGWNSFNWEEIETCNIDIADDKESYWISFYNSKINGYNMTDGGLLGTRGQIHTKETKEKISKGNTGKIRTPEQLQRLSIACSGSKNGMYNKNHTQKSKNIMSKKASIRYVGKGNPCSKKWKLVSPNNAEYIIEGTLKEFCKNYNLIMSLLKRFLNTTVDISKLKIIHGRHKLKTENTNGWSLYSLDN